MFVLAPLMCAQSPDAGPKFEVAAIKPTPPENRMGIGLELRNGRLHGNRVSLKAFVAIAYGLSEPLLIAPEWLDTAFFDIQGKSPEGVPDSAIRPMLQSLLQVRFHLAVHRETHELAAYELVIAKSGPKIKPYPAPENPTQRYPPGSPQMRGEITMDMLATVLSRFTGKPVSDKAGLGGRYNLNLVFAPLVPKTGDAPDVGGPPDLFTAIQEQLGLKLEPTKASVEIVVVDHIDREPTEN